MSQMCAPEEDKASGTLGCFRESTTSKSRVEILSPSSALVMHMQIVGPGLGHTEHPGVIPMTDHKHSEGTAAPFTERESEKAGTVPPGEVSEGSYKCV